jgi:glycosyltransferase involved in cell wall biosynthesis
MHFKPNRGIILDDGSNANKKFTHIWSSKSTVVHHAIDTDIYKKIPKRDDILGQLNLSNARFIILSTGLLGPIKNIDLAIKAFKIFSSSIENLNSYFLILGAGEMKEYLEELSHNLGLSQNVIFLGDIKSSNVIEYISIADVIVGTSLYSNMNRSIQEAMACEKPVVVFDSGNTRKLIRHMENGILIKPGDIEELSRQIQCLYKNPRLRYILGKNARETIIEMRSWDKRIKIELDVYKNLVH